MDRGGGIVVLWKEKCTANLLSYSKNHVHVEIQSVTSPKWRFTGFYGFLAPHRRRESCNNLSWCCMGDFNDLLSQKENRGTACYPREAIDACDLEEVRVINLLENGQGEGTTR